MTNEKLNQIIARKNEQLEQEAVYAAQRIIDGIAQCQGEIRQNEAQIATLREELKKLEIQQLDSTKILG